MNERIKNKLYDLLYRTENNIDFYLHEEKCNSVLNEIGVMRGILYCLEKLTGEQIELTSTEKDYIELQQSLKEIDNAYNINKTK